MGNEEEGSKEDRNDPQSEPNEATGSDAGAEAAAEAPETLDQKLAGPDTDGWKDRCLRAMADLQNLQRRLGREKELIRQTTVRELLRAFLPSFDNLERALSAGEQTDAKSLLMGVSMVSSEIQRILIEQDVRVVDPAPGTALDPNVHEAVSRVPSPDIAEGQILAVLERGYLIGEIMIRPARVILATKPVTDGAI